MIGAVERMPVSTRRTLARGQLAEKDDERRAGGNGRGPEESTRWPSGQLIEAQRIGNRHDSGVRNTKGTELAPFRVADCNDPRGARQDSPSKQKIEDVLRRPAPLDIGRGPIRSDDVRDSGRSKVVRGDHARDVAARMEMGHIEIARVFSAGNWRGPSARTFVRDTRDDSRYWERRDAGPRRLQRTAANRERIGNATRADGRITDVGRAQGEMVTSGRQTSAERLDDARDPAVGPRVAAVGCDMKDAKRSHGRTEWFASGATMTERLKRCQGVTALPYAKSSESAGANRSDHVSARIDHRHECRH